MFWKHRNELPPVPDSAQQAWEKRRLNTSPDVDHEVQPLPHLILIDEEWDGGVCVTFVYTEGEDKHFFSGYGLLQRSSLFVDRNNEATKRPEWMCQDSNGALALRLARHFEL